MNVMGIKGIYKNKKIKRNGNVLSIKREWI